MLYNSVSSLFPICYAKVSLYPWLGTYCLPIFFTSIYASDKKCIRKVVMYGIKLGIEHLGIDDLMPKQTRALALRYIHDEEHFINDFLDKCQSGRYHAMKYRGA